MHRYFCTGRSFGFPGSGRASILAARADRRNSYRTGSSFSSSGTDAAGIRHVEFSQT